MELTLIADEEICAASCCDSRRRRTASELFERGLRRNRLDPFAITGSPLRNRGGLIAQFSLQRHGALITSIRFKASTCATLIAYCELIAELARARSITECASLSPHLLVSELPDVPAAKVDRAFLAVAAFHSALAQAKHSEVAETANQGMLLGYST